MPPQPVHLCSKISSNCHSHEFFQMRIWVSLCHVLSLSHMIQMLPWTCCILLHNIASIFYPTLKLVIHKDETFLWRKDLLLKTRPLWELLFSAHKEKLSRPAQGSWGLLLCCSLRRDLPRRTAGPQRASVTLTQVWGVSSFAWGFCEHTSKHL